MRLAEVLEPVIHRAPFFAGRSGAQARYAARHLVAGGLPMRAPCLARACVAAIAAFAFVLPKDGGSTVGAAVAVGDVRAVADDPRRDTGPALGH